MEARFSASVQNGPGAHSASCTMGTGYFSGVKSGRGVTLTPHPLLVLLVKKEYSYTSTLPMGRTARTELHCLDKGVLYLLFTIPEEVIVPGLIKIIPCLLWSRNVHCRAHKRQFLNRIINQENNNRKLKKNYFAHQF